MQKKRPLAHLFLSVASSLVKVLNKHAMHAQQVASTKPLTTYNLLSSSTLLRSVVTWRRSKLGLYASQVELLNHDLLRTLLTMSILTMNNLKKKKKTIACLNMCIFYLIFLFLQPLHMVKLLSLQGLQPFMKLLGLLSVTQVSKVRSYSAICWPIPSFHNTAEQLTSACPH